MRYDAEEIARWPISANAYNNHGMANGVTLKSKMDKIANAEKYTGMVLRVKNDLDALNDGAITRTHNKISEVLVEGYGQYATIF